MPSTATCSPNRLATPQPEHSTLGSWRCPSVYSGGGPPPDVLQQQQQRCGCDARDALRVRQAGGPRCAELLAVLRRQLERLVVQVARELQRLVAGQLFNLVASITMHSKLRASCAPSCAVQAAQGFVHKLCPWICTPIAYQGTAGGVTHQGQGGARSGHHLATPQRLLADCSIAVCLFGF
jgi:hypothetical protein